MRIFCIISVGDRTIGSKLGAINIAADISALMLESFKQLLFLLFKLRENFRVESELLRTQVLPTQLSFVDHSLDINKFLGLFRYSRRIFHFKRDICLFEYFELGG